MSKQKKNETPGGFWLDVPLKQSINLEHERATLVAIYNLHAELQDDLHRWQSLMMSDRQYSGNTSMNLQHLLRLWVTLEDEFTD